MTCKKKHYIKKRYAKQQRAKFEATYWKRYRIYRCDDCGTYHLTTNKEGQQYFRTHKRKDE